MTRFTIDRQGVEDAYRQLSAIGGKRLVVHDATDAWWLGAWTDPRQAMTMTHRPAGFLIESDVGVPEGVVEVRA